MSKECADCGNERIMLCPFCEHDFSEASKQKDAELTALREAVRVLGKHVAAWKHTNDMYLEGSGSDIDLALEGVRLAEEATNANPTALAAVDKP